MPAKSGLHCFHGNLETTILIICFMRFHPKIYESLSHKPKNVSEEDPQSYVLFFVLYIYIEHLRTTPLGLLGRDEVLLIGPKISMY